MKKKLILVIVSITILSGCKGKLSNATVNSTSANSSAVNSTMTEELSSDSNASNYTLEVIRELAEKSENLDTVIYDLYDTPDNYKILAEPAYEEYSYSFVIGSPDEEPVLVTDNKKDIEKYTLSKNPEATSIKKVKQLIEELKQQRSQND